MNSELKRFPRWMNSVFLVAFFWKLVDLRLPSIEIKGHLTKSPSPSVSRIAVTPQPFPGNDYKTRDNASWYG